ncbi:MAG: heme o synthase [Candidatus Korarchaeum sp.]|nr:heme o synthase [Candidatus Korarchaeum sp.]MDW8035217.1 heme o synthase [Candidatus Korarchaeum sp.]
MQVSSLKLRLSDLLCLTKPKQTFLLLLTSIFTYLGAGGTRLDTLVMLAAAMLLSISGTTSVNMALDSDIDAMMPRTKDRPVPAGRLSRQDALLFGLLLFSVGLALSSIINLWTTFSTSLGMIFDIVVYTLWTKRRTPLSIVFGGVAGAAPSLAGWAAAKGTLEVQAVLIALITILWIPSHIWYISIYYFDDYAKAHVPMAPVIWGIERTSKLILASNFLLIALQLLLFAIGPFGPVFLLFSLPITLRFLYHSIKYARRPERGEARRMYKVASPVEGVIFLGIALDGIMRSLAFG